MDVVGLAVSVAGLVVGVVGLYLAFVPLRGLLRRRPGPPPAAATYDTFISYAQPDRDHAERLAAGLRQLGLQPFLAEWIEPGLVELLEKERALANVANGILIYSRATMQDRVIRDEYAAMLQRVHNGGRRFVPVLVEEVELPPFAAIRKPLNLYGAGGASYQRQLTLLARALRAR